MKKQQSKVQKLWKLYSSWLLAILGIGGGVTLIYLDISYKKGYLTVDWGGYVSTAIAIVILAALLIWYIKKSLYVFGFIRKPKNRPSK